MFAWVIDYDLLVAALSSATAAPLATLEEPIENKSSCLYFAAESAAGPPASSPLTGRFLGVPYCYNT